MNLQHFEIDPADILRVWINAEIDGFGLLLAEVRRQLAKVYVVWAIDNGLSTVQIVIHRTWMVYCTV